MHLVDRHGRARAARPRRLIQPRRSPVNAPIRLVFVLLVLAARPPAPRGAAGTRVRPRLVARAVLGADGGRAPGARPATTHVGTTHAASTCASRATSRVSAVHVRSRGSLESSASRALAMALARTRVLQRPLVEDAQRVERGARRLRRFGPRHGSTGAARAATPARAAVARGPSPRARRPAPSRVGAHRAQVHPSRLARPHSSAASQRRERPLRLGLRGLDARLRLAQGLALLRRAAPPRTNGRTRHSENREERGGRDDERDGPVLHGGRENLPERRGYAAQLSGCRELAAGPPSWHHLHSETIRLLRMPRAVTGLALALAASGVIALPAAAEADIYKFTDADGRRPLHEHARRRQALPRLHPRQRPSGKPGSGPAPGVIPVPPSDHDIARYTRYDGVDPRGGDALPDPRAARPRHHPLRERLRSARRQRLGGARPHAADARHGRR